MSRIRKINTKPEMVAGGWRMAWASAFGSTAATYADRGQGTGAHPPQKPRRPVRSALLSEAEGRGGAGRHVHRHSLPGCRQRDYPVLPVCLRHNHPDGRRQSDPAAPRIRREPAGRNLSKAAKAADPAGEWTVRRVVRSLRSGNAVRAINAWRLDDLARFDFSEGDVRLDVKATSGRGLPSAPTSSSRKLRCGYTASKTFRPSGVHCRQASAMYTSAPICRRSPR